MGWRDWCCFLPGRGDNRVARGANEATPLLNSATQTTMCSAQALKVFLQTFGLSELKTTSDDDQSLLARLKGGETLSKADLDAISKTLICDQIQIDVKLAAGAVGWQAMANLYQHLYPNFRDQAIKYTGYLFLTGFGAMAALNLGMYGAQAILAKTLGAEAASTLVTTAIQLGMSVTLADGAWDLAYTYAQKIPVLPYLAEALLFAGLQNFSSCWLEKILGKDHKAFALHGNAFKSSLYFMVLVGAAYNGFDYVTGALNKSLNIAADSWLGLGTAALGTAALPAGIQLAQSTMFNLIRCAYENQHNLNHGNDTVLSVQLAP